LEILRRDIHDGRVMALIAGLLDAGYMKDMQRHETPGGTPQGGIISPLLANIYLNELDEFVKDTLLPEYTRGERRQENPQYAHLLTGLKRARRHEDLPEIRRHRRMIRSIPSVDCYDPAYRRLRYVRYADDFLLGFVGPKKEAEEIRDRIKDYLQSRLKLSLSMEKTLVTHAAGDKAKFLGYEITASRSDTLIAANGRRSANGNISLLMPRKAVAEMMERYSKSGKVVHRPEILSESDYTIIERYQSVLRGLYNYFCMAVNVSKRMNTIKWILETSLTKTLASKHRCSVAQVYRKYRVANATPVCLRVTIERPDKTPLIATFGGISFLRKPQGQGDISRFDAWWFNPGRNRSEVVCRLLADRCELCDGAGPVVAHHIRRLADINRPGRKPKAAWEEIMSARRRKTLMVCMDCHKRIHSCQHDGPTTRRSLESRVR
jgi:Type II intron maturase/AI2M/AI1M-like, HNH endonuclease/Reverse transcriptase (RNA-dependent DNA polymerase)